MREAIGYELECERGFAGSRLAFHQIEMTNGQPTAQHTIESRTSGTATRDRQRLLVQHAALISFHSTEASEGIWTRDEYGTNQPHQQRTPIFLRKEAFRKYIVFRSIGDAAPVWMFSVIVDGDRARRKKGRSNFGVAAMTSYPIARSTYRNVQQIWRQFLSASGVVITLPSAKKRPFLTAWEAAATMNGLQLSSIRESPRRLARPRTSPFHGGNTGSNPVGDAKSNQAVASSSL